MLKLPRTIRLDPSDTFVFERAAEPGEWAVSGAFVFFDCDPATLPQKQRVALRSGFLGIDSLGWSTLAIVTEATDAEREAAIARSLPHNCCSASARRMRRRRGLPRKPRSRLPRRSATMRRKPCSPCSGRWRTARSASAFAHCGRAKSRAGADPLHAQARAFTFHEVEGGDEDTEQVDLRGLIEADRK